MDGTFAGAGRAVDTAGRMWPAPSTEARVRQDAELMLAYARGDAAAFAELYSRHKGGTYRYFLRHLRGEQHVAEELHQDLWLRVVAARQRYAAEAKFTTWLYTLARNRLVDHWRSAGSHRAASLDADDAPEAREALEREAIEADGAVGPLRATLDAEAGRRLAAALQATPPPQRDAFLLHVEAGLSLVEIAALTGTPAETVKSRLRYAYRRLREALEDLQ